jgi:lysophospholipase L1-like esterase
VVNLSADGARYKDFAQQLQSASGRFDTVLVMGGGNDVIRLTGEDKLREQVERVAALAREHGARVILMPPGNVGNAPFFMRPVSWYMDRRSRMLHGIVRETAARTGAAYVNLYKDRESDPFAQRPEELHAADGLHPSDAGYRLWVEELRRQAALG